MLRDTYSLTEFVNADTIAQGLSAYNPEGVAFEAGRVMLKRVHDLAEQRTTFAFETTLSSRSYAAWIRGLRQSGYVFNLLFLWLDSPELAIQRVEGRVRRGGHDVPEHVIRRRYFKGTRNFFTLYRSLAESWGVYDNSDFGNPQLMAQGSGDNIQEVFLREAWRQFVRQADESRT